MFRVIGINLSKTMVLVEWLTDKGVAEWLPYKSGKIIWR